MVNECSGAIYRTKTGRINPTATIQERRNIVMAKNYRKGAVGALMDEYERASAELKILLNKISAEDFVKIVDPNTKDEDCRSIQSIMNHVVRAGYGYSNYIRKGFGIDSTMPTFQIKDVPGTILSFDQMLEYTVQTLEGKWEMTDEEINKIKIETRWGATYDMEMLLEHAIVHILRHRRQIERFLIKLGRM